MSVEMMLAVVVAVVVIVVANVIARKVGVAGPLLLVGIGVVIGFLPIVPALSVPPELILVGVLPPLLYSAAVSAPAIEFRRDSTAIGGMAVLLVIVSAVLLGLFFAWAIPDLGLALGIALGAILSPTDAVATSIIKKLGVPRRVLTVLEGESLLNDATDDAGDDEEETEQDVAETGPSALVLAEDAEACVDEPGDDRVDRDDRGGDHGRAARPHEDEDADDHGEHRRRCRWRCGCR